MALEDETLAAKITGMVLEQPDESLRLLLIDEGALRERIHEAVHVLHQALTRAPLRPLWWPLSARPAGRPSLSGRVPNRSAVNRF